MTQETEDIEKEIKCLEGKILTAVNQARKWTYEDLQFAKAWASMAYEYMQDRKRLLGRDYD